MAKFFPPILDICISEQPHIVRDILQPLLQHLGKKEVMAIVGARQVGKTFLIKKLIEYLLQNQPDQFQRQTEFISFIEQYGKPSQTNYIFLDEFQRLPDGGLLLKSYYDLGLDLKFVISGSSSLTPKLYFVDTGIRNAVFRQFGALQMRADRGQLVENFVFSELLKRVSQDHLWFFRTRNGSEIDFIFETGQEIIPIEVKYSLTPQKVVPRMFASMQGFPDVKMAYVLTRDSCLTQTIGKRAVKFLPVWAMHYLEL